MRTSIQVTDRTRRRLVAHKAHERQPYDEVINEALDIVEEDDLELSPEYRRRLARSRRQYRQGRYKTTKQLIEELGL
ncbi:MAG TPA: hypothetical protein VJ547_08005 [Candidatus Thermoplasmatota archaeon]|nr:hypothetical protein [Candidatus Thermoplasmatota archaeon]